MSDKAHEPTVFRYLKFRSKRGFVRGTTLCRHLRIPPHRLPELNNHEGVGSLGPAGINPKNKSQWIRYAKRNVYMADFRFFFRHDGMIMCHGKRDLRKGKFPPNRSARAGVNR